MYPILPTWPPRLAGPQGQERLQPFVTPYLVHLVYYFLLMAFSTMAFVALVLSKRRSRVRVHLQVLPCQTVIRQEPRRLEFLPILQPFQSEVPLRPLHDF